MQRNVLVVEDDFHQQRILTLALQSYGVGVEAYASVADAVAAFDRHGPAYFSVAILDDMLLDGSGAEVLAHIRSSDSVIPVIFLSARSDVIASRLYAGADNYLVKPQSPETVVAYVEAAISRMSAHFSVSEENNSQE